MGLYRRKDSPIWYMSFMFEGRQCQRSTDTDDKKEALRRLDFVKGKIAEKKWFPETVEDQKREHTFSELVERYRAWAPPRHKGWEDVEKTIVRQLNKRFGATRLNDFTTYMVEQFQGDELARGLVADTVNRSMTVLKSMFGRASDWDMINDEILKRVRKAKQLTDVTHRLRFLSLDECETLHYASEPHLKPIITTALNTGLRKSNILNLRWDQVDLKHGFILLENKTVKNKERLEVPINESLRATLQGLTRRLDVPYVFYNPATAKPYGDVKRAFQSACRRAKIQDFHFHDLRHTFASHLVMAGVDLTTVKELLGHKNIKMTLRYAHLAPAHKVEAVNKLGNLFARKNLVQDSEKMVKYYNSMTVSQNADMSILASH
ncbi:MAG: site-specific integrase [Nitrospirae bacterium]|nr:site-specific integrase [Nitrospirota bacterium]